ncbi:MAG: cell surface protein SprA [Crocinitomicaceae bacterium]|nr:cell surface protein SprA [Crocinitomicaceae bacterium]
MKYTVILLLLIAKMGYGQGDTLVFPITNSSDPTNTTNQSFDLGDPTSVQQTIVYDPLTGTYVFKETMGSTNLNYRNPSMMTLDEYLEYERQKTMRDNWKDKIDQQTAESQPMEFPIKIGSKLFKSFFGSDQIVIRPTGSVELSFGVNSSRYDNPLIPVKQRKITRFDFDQQINLNLVGQIGTRVKLGVSYNTQAQFEFDNQTKLEYNGDEDQIIQSIALGNVSMELPTTLIPGTQTAFGVTTKLRFGHTTLDFIMASSKGQRTEINIEGGAQVQEFELNADNYEANRHYFVNMYHHENYDDGMSTLPIVNSTINITKMEVWLTNKTNNTTNTRNIIGFTDLGEESSANCQGDPGNYWAEGLPDNEANGLYAWASTNPLVRGFSSAVAGLTGQVAQPGPFEQAIDYEKVENARMLTEQEFTYNAQLGFISLNLPLNNDEVLAVAYQYSYQGKNYQVGEFSTDGIAGQDALILKLIKPTITNPKNKLWDLMMKNVYSIGAYQVDQEGFRLNMLYNNPATSLVSPVFPTENLGLTPVELAAIENQQIVTLLGMDKINQNNQPYSDGVFDFVPIIFNGNRAENGGTINTRNGRVYFSTIEPFGKTLSDRLFDAGVAPSVIDRIAFQELYDSTKTAAQQIPSKNRFSFKGEYQSSISSDIPLNALNVPEGAVSVTAGGIKLTEGVDFTVDYNLGRVKILNSGILESGTPITISVESNSVFGFQSKSLFGARVSRKFGNKFNLGATWIRMMERPVTQKVDIGSEPFKNNVIGFDFQYRTEVPFLTKLVDLLPIISTKEKSTFSLSGEFAHLIPGQPKAIEREGTSYVDDFEGSQSTIDIKTIAAWKLASVPQGQPDLFPEAGVSTLSAGFKRSRLAWYVIDPVFYQSNSLTPQHIIDNSEMIYDSRVRAISQQEYMPGWNPEYGAIINATPLELAYYPRERGMYNYDTTATVNPDGTFINPENRWGGIMRALTTTDFEQTNIEYIQFWVLDPFNEDAEAVDPNATHNGGDLYFNLGNVSEDILPDSRKTFENGLPPTGVSINDDLDTTDWARVSTQQVVVNAFDNDPTSRINQDVGLDGWNNEDERIHFANYVAWVQSSGMDPDVIARMIDDPSQDDYNYYLDDDYDIEELHVLDRYKKYNGTQGNSPTQEMSETANADGYITMATSSPDVEDINQDNNLSESESYFQYRVSMRPGDMVVGKNFITDEQTYEHADGQVDHWYQFKVPIRDYERKVNGITDFRSIRFMRMFLKDFDEEVVLRFGRLEFIRGEWRRYMEDLTTPGEGDVPDPNLTTFNIGAVNIQENDNRSPVPYVVPPGINQEVDPSNQYERLLNEQSMSLEVCNLRDGDARAAYKNVQFDVRAYKKMKMFVHAEEVLQEMPLNDEDVTVFIRLGTDFTDNYYEYEMPLKVTAPGSSSDTDIWPEENFVEIIFEDFLNMKKARNELIEAGNVSISYISEYSVVDPANENRILRLKGNPNLQGMKTIMIGIRNPHTNSHSMDEWTEDSQPKCAIVWVNELRLTDFVTEGGSAAVAQMQVQLADFASVTMSGTYKGINWGAVESRVQERQRNEQIGFDMTANVQLGQFFGKKAGVSLPFFYGYSLGIVNPEYDPFNPDIKLKSYDAATRRERSKMGQDFVERKSYNFTGVRKAMKAGVTPRFWRLSNWSANYAYTENLSRDFNTNYDRTKTWSGGLNYSYAFTPKPITPFKNVKFMRKSKWWGLIRDFNFYLLPKNISFNSDIMRSYNERQVRNNIVPDYEFAPVYVKRFNWNRQYGLAYDLTKKLKFSFSATNSSIFKEGNERVDRKEAPDEYRNFEDTVTQQLGTLGTTMDYTHNYSINYTLPLEKLPLTDWMNASFKYSATYNWQRAPLAQPEYGHTIQNSRNVGMTAQLNFVNLYNKIPFFKKINSGNRGNNGRVDPRKKAGGDTKPDDATPPGEEEVPDEDLTEREKKKKERKEEREEKKEEREKKRDGKAHPVVGFLARMLMTVRNVNGTYTLTDGTLLPGYNQGTSVLGFNQSMDGAMGGFIFGQQRYDIFGRETGYNVADIARDNEWLVENENLNKQYTTTHTANLTLGASLEPIKDLSITLSLNRTFSTSTNEFYRWNPDDIDPTQGVFESQSRVEISTLSYTSVSIGSAFAALGEGYSSATFNKLLDNRAEVSQILGAVNTNSNAGTSDYRDGYSGSHQEVVLGAFMTAYTDRSVNKKNINPMDNMPLPNWSVTYNGLKKFKFMKKILRNFVLKHAYSSTVLIGGMQTNMEAGFDANGNANIRDLNNNFMAGMVIKNVSVQEQFGPLIGFDATWVIKGQGLITKFEYKKSRTATLALTNNQVTEVLGTEWIIGIGYKFAKVKIPIKRWNIPASPVNIRFDMSFRDNLTVIRKVVENTNQATAGQRVISLKASIDYNVSRYVTVMLYYDQTMNTPKIATSYPTGNLNAGLRLRFNLAGVQ